jgi:O-antigen ligase
VSHSPAISGMPANWSAPSLQAAPKTSLLLVSALLGAAIPLILSLYWIAFSLAPEALGTFLRVSVLACSFLLAFLWSRVQMTWAEVNLVRILGVAAVLWLIPSLMATDPAHAIAGWIKLLVLFAFCCFAARGLRHPATAQLVGLALLASAFILVAFMLVTYVRYLGFAPPTYKTTREFKGIAQIDGIPLNSIAFEAVFCYLSGLCLVRTNRILIAIAVPLFVISSIFTGSRAPLVILGASAFVMVCLNGLRNRSAQWRIATLLLILTAVVGGTAVVINASDKEVNTATEGRSHLWSVGLQKFTERPLFGFGYESWRDDLVSRLPGEKELTFDLAKSQGGGYHNEYISVLAEEGLLGFLAAGLIVWLLLRSAWLLSFRRWSSVNALQWPLFACVFLLLRANFEVPGLFGYAQDPTDYLAYFFVAVIVSRFSTEEDYARLLAKRRTGEAI